MKLPTTTEVKVARVLEKRGKAMVREALKVLVKVRRKRVRRRKRHASPAETVFYTWKHDLQVLMRAVARTPDADRLGVTGLTGHAVSAADRMSAEVESRRPAGANAMFRSFGTPGETDWIDWQEMFDGLVHDLADRSNMDAPAVINRASALADEMIKIVKRRRPRGMR